MRRSTRQAARAANKARLSGAIISDPPKNKKIAFADDDDDDDDGNFNINVNAHTQSDDNNKDNNPIEKANEIVTNEESKEISDTVDQHQNDYDDDQDDEIEEVTGTAARASMQKSRDVERQVSKESSLKKKRKKKNIAAKDDASKVENDIPESEDESDDENEDADEEILTDDFFKMVDSERASHSQKMKQEKKHNKILQKKLLGKHTTFVVDTDYGTSDTPHPINSNIEVVALGEVGGGDSNETRVNDERKLLTSATLGMAPSKAAVTFARGSMSSGTSKERGRRKRKSKDEETWTRSRKLNRLGIGHRPGQAAALFVRKMN